MKSLIHTDHLNLERKRIEKLTLFLHDKLENKIKYSQSDLLIKGQEEERAKVKDAIIGHLIPNDSIMHKNLSLLFQNVYFQGTPSTPESAGE